MQAVNTTRVATDDPDVLQQVLARLTHHLQAQGLDQTPAALSQPVYELVAALSGCKDPYAAGKAHSNESAVAMLPDLRVRIAAATDPLDAALHCAVAGNVIDLGIGYAFDLERDVLALMERPFAISAIEALRSELRPGVRLLYLGDNAGEIALDMPLVETFLAAGARVTYCVKSGPIINDATMTDARAVGMTDLVPVIETGAADIGVNFDNVSARFRAAYACADIILAKGHGNFETCNDRPGNRYFLLKAKCCMVADALGVTMGDIVFKHLPA